jgi:hypothetical protein
MEFDNRNGRYESIKPRNGENILKYYKNFELANNGSKN